MTATQELPGAVLGRARYIAAEEPDTYLVVPVAPGLGAPPVLLVGDEGAQLQIQAEWGLSPDELAEVRAMILAECPETDPAALRLTQPAAAPGVARLLLGDGAPEPAYGELLARPHSGLSPFIALLSIALDAGQKELAIAAFNGRPGFLAVRYDVALDLPVAVTATVAGDAGPLVAELSGARRRQEAEQVGFLLNPFRARRRKSEPKPVLPPTLADCRERIAAAISAGALRLECDERGEVPEELRQAAVGEAMDLTAGQLQALVASATAAGALPAAAGLSAVVRRRGLRRYEIEQTADLAGWLGPEGEGRILVVPGAGGSPAPVAGAPASTRTVRFDLPAGRLPIREVALRAGRKRVGVRPDGWGDGVNLEAEDGQPLTVAASYVAGGPYTVEKPAGEEWTITLADLGLARVVVDASRLRDEGARRAQVRVQYQPDGDGKRDQTTISFTERDASWVADWYVITRAPELAGTLIWEWQSSPARGAAQRQNAVETKDTLLKI